MSKFYTLMLLSTVFMMPALSVAAEETPVEEATSSLKANLNFPKTELQWIGYKPLLLPSWRA